MQVKQRLSILFFLKKRQKSEEQECPIYVRIKIDGFKEDISLSIKILPGQWDEVNKRVTCAHPKWKGYNKKINNARTDIERHFDLMQFKHGLATPAMVKKSYISPLSGQQIQIGKNVNSGRFNT